MNMYPRISVIIPNYNNSRWIEQCVSSVASQTYPNVEIVVVDDCSTDDSRQIIDWLATHYANLKKIYLKQNGGVSHARNVGAHESTGEYLEFLDGDDFFYADDKLANEMALIQKHLAHGMKVMAYSCVACVNEEGCFVEDRGLSGQLEGHIVEAYLANYKKERHSRNVLVDREAFEEAGGFDESMSFWEDSDWFIRMLFIRPNYCTHTLGTAYRWRRGGLSRNTLLSGLAVQRELEHRYRRRFTVIQWIYYFGFKSLRMAEVLRLYTWPEIKHWLYLRKQSFLKLIQ